MTQAISERLVRLRRDRYNNRFKEFSVIHREIGNRLLEQLAFIKINPKNILDFGAATGYTSKFLRKRYPSANLFAYDLSQKMLKI